jgi:hypothetical protein
MESNEEEVPIKDCIGINTNKVSVHLTCNGKQDCNVDISRAQNSFGHHGTNCDFESNQENIHYMCIPTEMRYPYKSFDICDRNGPEKILGITEGFIHSPKYPNYYGNSRNCLINIGVPNGKRLVISQVTFNMEGNSIFDKSPNDYIRIESNGPLTGMYYAPSIVYDSADRSNVQIRFKSDWITTTILSKPKGFLLYYKCKCLIKD